MKELIQQTSAILAQAQEWLKMPGVKETVTGFLSWKGKKIFSKIETALERLILIAQQQADAETIAWLHIIINCKSKPELHPIQNPATTLKFLQKSKGVQFFLPMEEWKNKINNMQ